VRLPVLPVLAMVSGCSLLLPDLTSRFGLDSGVEPDAGLTADGGEADGGLDAGGGDGGPGDAGADGGSNDAGSGLDGGGPDAGAFCEVGSTWCEGFDAFDAGRYAQVTAFDGGHGVVVDVTRATSWPASLRVLHAANAPDCSDALAGLDVTGGPFSTLTLSTAVRFEARVPEVSLFYVQRGTGNAICAIYVRAMQDGRVALLEQVPTATSGVFESFTDESDAGLRLGTWHRVELEFRPSNSLEVRLDGRPVLSRAVSRPCTAPASAVEFKLGSVCTTTEPRAREFWLDDVRFNAR
jgi:hypothetical protein